MSNAERLTALAVFLFLTSTSMSALDQEAPSKLLSEGRTLIKKNCPECYKATKEQLADGILKVERAIDSGMLQDSTQLREAYNLLTLGCRDLAIGFAQPDSEEYRIYHAKAERAAKWLTDLEPKRVDLLFDYSLLVGDPGEKEGLWRRIKSMDPSFLQARVALGQLLVEKGSIDEGLSELHYSFDHAKNAEARRIGKTLVFFLHSLGREKEAEKIQKKVDALPRE